MEVPATTGTPTVVEEDSPVAAREAVASHMEAEEVRPVDLRHQVLQETPAIRTATGEAHTRRIVVESRRYGRGMGKAYMKQRWRKISRSNLGLRFGSGGTGWPDSKQKFQEW